MHPKCTLFVSASFLLIVSASSCRVYHTTSTSAPPTEDRVVVVREKPRVIVVREQPQVVVVKEPANNVDLARKLELERLEKERLEKERLEKEKKDKDERFKQIAERREQLLKEKRENQY